MDWIWRNIIKKLFVLVPTHEENRIFIKLDLKYNEMYLAKLEKRQKELMDFVKDYEGRKKEKAETVQKTVSFES
jgi:hypothetical protein